jgi:hypothetical protein
MIGQLLQGAAPRPRGTGSPLADFGSAMMAGQQAGNQFSADAIRAKLMQAQIAQAQQQQTTPDPAAIREMQTLGYPMTQDGFKQYNQDRAERAGSVYDELNARLSVMEREERIARERAEAEEKSKAREGEERQKAARAAGGAGRVLSAWDALDTLSRSAIAQPGFQGSSRAQIASALALGGIEDPAVSAAAEQFKDVATISGAELIKELGLDPTDVKFRAITNASLSLDKSDATNRLQLQRLAQAALSEVDAGRLSLPEETVAKLRGISEWTEAPTGDTAVPIESLLNKYAPAAR